MANTPGLKPANTSTILKNKTMERAQASGRLTPQTNRVFTIVVEAKKAEGLSVLSLFPQTTNENRSAF